MKLLKQYLILSILASICLACSDFEESDLSKEKVVLIAPGDSTTNDETQQFFIWEDLNEDDQTLDVDYYNIQIAEPDFDNPKRFILDSNTSNSSYIVDLEPGDYQWRVRAENASSRTSYTTRTLFIDSSFILTNVPLTLTAPLPGHKFNVDKTGERVTFSWDPITGADEYRVQVVFGSFTSSNPVQIADITTSSTAVTVTIPYRENINEVIVGHGQYEWRVTATNFASDTRTFETSNFSADTNSVGQ